MLAFFGMFSQIHCDICNLKYKNQMLIFISLANVRIRKNLHIANYVIRKWNMNCCFLCLCVCVCALNVSVRSNRTKDMKIGNIEMFNDLYDLEMSKMVNDDI